MFESNGIALDYAIIFFFSGSAFLIYFYLHYNGKTDFDESPKHQMLKDEEYGA